jgi:hypothetical protein
MTAIKGILVFIFSIWFIGAAGMTVYYKLDEKRMCIENEGLIKGVFWCEQTIKTKFDIASEHSSHFIKGLKWPIILFSNDKGTTETYSCSLLILDAKSIYEGNKTPEIINRASRVGAYLEDEKVLPKLSLLYKRKQSDPQQLEQLGAQIMDQTYKVCLSKPAINVKSAMMEAIDSM